jgi:hypothetical protein
MFADVVANPFRILAKPFPLRSWIFAGMLACYILASLFVFYLWIAPSLDGRTDQHITADSVTYLYFAETLRAGRFDPWVMAALSTFPNTLWAPVLIALILKSTLAIVLANYVIFFVAIALLKKSFSFSTGVFISLLLLNATTTISLLSVNKEIIDLFAISLFLFAYRKRKRSLLLIALAIAFFNRFEVCLVMLVFLFAQTRFNPWRRRRGVTLLVLTLALSVLLPLVAGGSLTRRFEEASSGGVIVWLDQMEMHYLYALAVVPKVAENLFGVLVNTSTWTAFSDLSDIANSYILLLNNLASAIVVMTLIWKRTLSARFEVIYLAMIGCILMAVSLVIQPRYFYFVYVLLSLQAAQPETRPLSTRLAASERVTANA